MNKNILALQMLLNNYENENLAEDGIYGPATADAVKRYLSVDTYYEETAVVDEPFTANFCLQEYYSNAVVDDKKIVKAIKPPQGCFGNILRSMERLENLRSALGDMPITITSGYRTPEYNKYIGGAENSAHLRGSAADIIVKGVHSRDVYAAADKIYPEGGVGLYNSFVHVDLDREVDRPKRW